MAGRDQEAWMMKEGRRQEGTHLQGRETGTGWEGLESQRTCGSRVCKAEDTRHRSLDASEETKRGARVPCPVDKSRLAPGSEGRQAGGRGRQHVRFESCLRGQGTGDWVRGSS